MIKVLKRLHADSGGFRERGGGTEEEEGMGEKRKRQPMSVPQSVLYQKVAQKPGANVCSPASPSPLTEALSNSLICIAHIKENKGGGYTHKHTDTQKKIITFHLINIKTAISEHVQASKEKLKCSKSPQTLPLFLFSINPVQALHS